MNTAGYVAKFLTMATLLLDCWSSRAADRSVAAPMIGHWEGDARIIVTWSRQTNLHVKINIGKDGSVTGKVGDATLINGHLQPNRGPLGRKLNLATDHVIRGNLNGPVVAAEGITRESVSIPLNFIGGAFVGGLHTSGSQFGGKEKMILSARSLTLKPSK